MSDLYTIFEDPELSASEPVELSSLEDDDPILLEEQVDGDWPSPLSTVVADHTAELEADPDVTVTEDDQSTPAPPTDSLAASETEI